MWQTSVAETRKATCTCAVPGTDRWAGGVTRNAWASVMPAEVGTLCGGASHASGSADDATGSRGPVLAVSGRVVKAKVLASACLK